MATILNRIAYDHAALLIRARRVEIDESGAWGNHKPNAQTEDEFIRNHGLVEYSKWYLGIDLDRPEEAKARYTLPIGDFQEVHLCGLLSAEDNAIRNDNLDIEIAAAHLHGMIAELTL